MDDEMERKVLALQEIIKLEKEADRSPEKQEYEITVKEFADLLQITDKQAVARLSAKVRQGKMTKRLLRGYTEEGIKFAIVVYSPV